MRWWSRENKALSIKAPADPACIFSLFTVTSVNSTNINT